MTLSPDDPDNRFLDCALTAKADFLITGNTKDFPFAEFKGTQIVTPAEFAAIFLSGRGFLAACRTEFAGGRLTGVSSRGEARISLRDGDGGVSRRFFRIVDALFGVVTLGLAASGGGQREYSPYVPAHGHEAPLATDVLKAAQGKLAETHYRFDDPEHGLRRLFAKRVELASFQRL